MVAGFDFRQSLTAGGFVCFALAAVPASALTTFAQFNQTDTTSVVEYQADGFGASLSLTPYQVFFDILAFGPLGTYDVTIAGEASTTEAFQIVGNVGFSEGWSGWISFEDAGINYLTVTFDNATLFGVVDGTNAGFLASQPTSAVTFTSDVIDVSLLKNRGFDLGISGIEPPYASGPAVYTGELTGGFSGEIVPEPAVWGMLITGFGLVGWSARRRRLQATGHISG